MSFLGSQLDEYVGSAIDPTADDDGGNDADAAEEKQSWQLNPLHAAKKDILGSRAQSVDLDRDGDDGDTAASFVARVDGRRGGLGALYPEGRLSSRTTEPKNRDRQTAMIPKKRSTTTAAVGSIQDKRVCARCRRWHRHHGYRGAVAVGMMVITLIYLLVMLVMHTVTGRVIPLSLDYLIEAPNVKEWLAITTWVSIWAGIAYSILLVRGTLLLVDMTCRSTNYNRKSLRKFNKSRTRIIPRLVHWYRSWFGPTGPYFQWKEFAKDVQETILQGIAMYDITASGVQATWLAIYTSVIFINSTFEPFFLHVKVRSEKTISEASNLKWVLIIGGCAELFYGMWPIALLLRNYAFIYSSAGRQWYCGGDEGGNGETPSCGERSEGILCLLAQEALLGSFDWSSVVLKFFTRLLPVYFAMSRFRAVVMLDALYVARLAHPQTVQFNSSVEMRGAASEGGRRTGSTSANDGPADDGDGCRTTRTPASAPKAKKTALQRLNSMVSQRFALRQKRKEVPRLLVAIYVFGSVGFCGFVWVRLALISSVCYGPAAPGDWIGRNDFPPLCKTPTFAVFSLSGFACPCHTFVASSYGNGTGQQVLSDCIENRTMEAIDRRFLDDANVAAEYARILVLQKCAFNATHLTKITDHFSRLQVLELEHPFGPTTGGSGEGAGPMARALDDGIGRLTRLRFIFLDHVGLTAVPETLQSVPQVSLIQFHHNLISSLPRTIGDILPRIRHVSLQHNLISGTLRTALPPTVTYFRLDDNHLDAVSEDVFGPHLEHMFSVGLTCQQGCVGGTGLQKLPLTLFTLPSLEQIFAEGNALTEIAPAGLATIPGHACTKLFRLELSRNKLTALPSRGVLSQLKHITQMKLNRNLLSTLDLEKAASTMTNLKELQIAEQQPGNITTLPDAVGSLGKLELLGLYRNSITSVSFGALARLSKLENVMLDLNPICQMEQMEDGQRPSYISCRKE